jgi:putative flavoprotein involved in K+ transport
MTKGATMTTTHATEELNTVVIGGGQAGLSAGYYLKRHGERFVVLDAGERVGDPWRRRWPSLRLYTPARYDGLPGMRFTGAASRFPTTDEMADYLEAYAARFELPVRSGVRATRLAAGGDGYVVETDGGAYTAQNVVVATGVMQTPVVPGFAADLDPRIRQLHSSDYRSPSQLLDGDVLVVGASHSGGDIAFELASTRRTILSGRDTGQLPFSVESRRARLAAPLLKLVATRVLTVDTPIGRKLQPQIRSHGAPLLRVRSRELEAAGVERVLERTIGVRDGRPALADGRVLDVANVVWCTGFRPDYGWIDLPVEYDDGYPRQYRGAVAGLPGLFFLGMLFLHSFSSMLVLGAGRDAKRVVTQIAARNREHPAVAPPAARAVRVAANDRASR